MHRRGPRARAIGNRKTSLFIRLIMIHRWPWRSIVRCIFTVAIIFQLMQVHAAYAQEVVVNLNVQEKTLTLSALRAIFSMRLRTWPDGSSIKVFVLSDDSPLHGKFSKNVLSVFPYQLRRTWNRLVYSGTGQAPIQIESIKEMAEQVASTPGAIGYLPEGKVSRRVRKIQVIQAEW